MIDLPADLVEALAADVKPWCPCHGSLENVRCVLRGDKPIVWIEICRCTKIDVYPPLRRYEVWISGKRRISHGPGCPIEPFDHEPQWFGDRGVAKGVQKEREADVRKWKKEEKQRAREAAQSKLKLP